MKFILYFFLIFHIVIKVDSLSLSFINIIPSIISNNRYVQEKIYDSNFLLNLTFPLINHDLILNVNQSNCTQDIQKLSHDLVSKQIWALKSND